MSASCQPLRRRQGGVGIFGARLSIKSIVSALGRTASTARKVNKARRHGLSRSGVDRATDGAVVALSAAHVRNHWVLAVFYHSHRVSSFMRKLGQENANRLKRQPEKDNTQNRRENRCAEMNTHDIQSRFRCISHTDGSSHDRAASYTQKSFTKSPRARRKKRCPND
jgi:hypothetical protein